MDSITTGIISIGILLLIYVVYELSRTVKNGIERMEENERVNDSQLLTNGFEAAKSAVETVTKAVVYKLEQTDARELRDSVKAGLEDRSRLIELADKAYQEIMEILSENAKEFLSTEIIDIEGYVRSLIEKNVLEAKSEASCDK